ncbi:MAG: hypothetical protein R2932_12305 [Caldilineaceae bacterium]
MAQNHLGELSCSTMVTAKPALSNNANFFPGMVQKWGLSGLINTVRSPQGRPAGSLAWAGLANTFFWIDSETGIAGLFMTQLFPFFDHGAIAAFRAFEAAVYGALS